MLNNYKLSILIFVIFYSVGLSANNVFIDEDDELSIGIGTSYISTYKGNSEVGVHFETKLLTQIAKTENEYYYYGITSDIDYSNNNFLFDMLLTISIKTNKKYDIDIMMGGTIGKNEYYSLTGPTLGFGTHFEFIDNVSFTFKYLYTDVNGVSNNYSKKDINRVVTGIAYKF